VGGPGAIVTREAQQANQPDYGGMAVPSVWRTNRTQAAAKVDALSNGGMDDFEIPAFLRKQAD
jgi:cell division protein FtsZ